MVRGLLYGLLIGAVAWLLWIANWELVRDQFFRVDIARAMFPDVITIAARNTVVYTVIAFGFGLVLGLVLALMKLSPIPPYRWIASIYIETFRGLPALVTIIFFATAIPIAFQWRVPGGFVGAGVVGLTVVAGAYMAETIRAGIQAVPKGQLEAARSLGMSASWTMISIVIPQAFRIVIPPLTNELVLLLKDTSLLGLIGATVATRELLGFGQRSLSTFANPTPLVVVAALYVAITIPLTRLVAVLERRNARAR